MTLRIINTSFNKIILLIFLLGFAGSAAMADYGYDPSDPDDTTDERNFTTNTLVKVKLNYRSFENQNFPSEFTQEAMERAIQTAINKWTQRSGFRLRIRYDGATLAIDPGDREIMIRAAAMKSSGAYASVAKSYNRADITFYRKDADRRDLPWALSDTSLASFTGSLMHELGHVFGLAHNYNSNKKTIMGYAGRYEQFGPFWEDIQDARDMYGLRPALKFKVQYSGNGGEEWSDIDSSLNRTNTYSHQTPVTIVDGARRLMFFNDLSKRPAYRSASNSGQNWGSIVYIKDQNSVYGVSGHGTDDEYMMAWVDRNLKLKVLRSGSNFSWHWRNPPTTYVSATPAIRKLDNNTWLLVYSKLTASPNGEIYFRISTNDGKSWSDERPLLADPFHPQYGVSIASTDKKNIFISFSRAAENVNHGTSEYGSIVRVNCELDANNSLKVKSVTKYNHLITANEYHVGATAKGNSKHGIFVIQQALVPWLRSYTWPLSSGAASASAMGDTIPFAGPALESSPDSEGVTVYLMHE